MAYDHPNHIIRREQSFLTVAGNGTSSARMLNFQKLRLKKVHARVVTAGTAAGHALNVYHGTTSIGAISLGTSAAGVTGSSAELNRTVESLELLAITNGTDATGVALVSYEYEYLPDGTPST